MDTSRDRATLLVVGTCRAVDVNREADPDRDETVSAQSTGRTCGLLMIQYKLIPVVALVWLSRLESKLIRPTKWRYKILVAAYGGQPLHGDRVDNMHLDSRYECMQGIWYENEHSMVRISALYLLLSLF